MPTHAGGLSLSRNLAVMTPVESRTHLISMSGWSSLKRAAYFLRSSASTAVYTVSVAFAARTVVAANPITAATLTTHSRTEPSLTSVRCAMRAPLSRGADSSVDARLCQGSQPDRHTSRSRNRELIASTTITMATVTSSTVDAAGADEAEDGGRAYVGLEPIEDIGEEERENLWHHTEAQDLQARGARGGDGVDGSGVDALDGLGVELGERGRCVGHDGEDAGEGAEPDRRHEEQGVDERVDAPEEVEHGPRRIEDGAARHVARGEEAERQRQDGGHRGAEQRDLDGFEGAQERRREHAQVRGHHAPDEVEDPRHAARQAHRVGAGVPDEPREDDQRDEERGPGHCSGVREAGLNRGWPEIGASRLRTPEPPDVGASRLRTPEPRFIGRPRRCRSLGRRPA